MQELPEGYVLDEPEAGSAELPEGYSLDVDPMESQGVLEKTRKALQYGVAQRSVGLGQTGKALFGKGETLERLGKSFAPDNYRPASGDFFDPQEKDKGLFGYGWGYAPRAIAESAPGLAMDLGVGALTGGTGFMVSNAASNFGPALEARVQNNGGAPAGTSDYLAAGAGTALNAYLNKVGINPAISSVPRGAGLAALAQIPKQIGKAGAVDAAAGAAGNVVDQVATTAGTDEGLDVDLKQVGGAGILAGGTGAAVRSARVPGDVTNAVRNSEFDPQSATRLADRMRTHGFDPDNGDKAYRSMNAAAGEIDAEIRVARKAAKPLIDEAGNEADVETIRAKLKTGEKLTPEDIEGLEASFGGRPEGDVLINHLKDKSTLNTLKTKGTWDDQQQTFQGGIAGKFDAFLNPTRRIGQITAAGASGATLASQYAIPFASQAGMAAGPLAGLLGAQVGAHAVVSGIDNVTGFRNPAQRFQKSFEGLEATPVSQGPTLKDIAAENAQTKEAGKQSVMAQKAADKLAKAQTKRDLEAYRVESGLKSSVAKNASKLQKQEARTKRLDDFKKHITNTETQGMSGKSYTDTLGRNHPIPSDLKNPDAYFTQLESNQKNIADILTIATDHTTNTSTQDVLKGPLVDKLHYARNRTDAESIIDKILKGSDESDRKDLSVIFSEILGQYSKEKQGNGK